MPYPPPFLSLALPGGTLLKGSLCSMANFYAPIAWVLGGILSSKDIHHLIFFCMDHSVHKNHIL